MACTWACQVTNSKEQNEVCMHGREISFSLYVDP